MGLRVSEAAGPTFGDVDFAEGRIRISRARTKRRTAGQRWLPLPDELLDEIAALCPLEDRARERPVFLGLTAGHSKASMLHDVYGHVVPDPNGDAWRAFRVYAYAAKRSPGVVWKRGQRLIHLQRHR